MDSKTKNAQAEQDMLLDLYKIHAYNPNDAVGNPLTPFGNFCAGYEACQALNDAKIAEIEEKRILQLSAISTASIGYFKDGDDIHADYDTTALRDVTKLYAKVSELEAKLKQKLWLWKNFVDGKPEYWAFDNPFPIHLDSGDPQAFGEPCGYAIFKESRQGRTNVSEEEVLRCISIALDKMKG